MFIKYNQYAPNPALRGTIADPKPHIAEQLVAQGIAEVYRYPTLKEHLDAIERFRARLNPVLPPAVVTWASAFGNINNRHYISAKCSRANCSTLVFDGPASAVESITFIHSAGCCGPEKIPAAVCESYRKVYRAGHILGRDEIDCAIAALPRTKEDWEAEKAIYAMKEHYETVDAENPSQRPYGIQYYAPTVDLPYDMTGVKKK